MWGLGLADIVLVAWYIAALVLMEGLLSADNALVLAVMVRHLPRNQQRRVLFYGIWGAVGFRVIALSLSSILLTLWYCKVFGGLYLLYLAGSHFLMHRDEAPGTSSAPGESRGPRESRLLGGFWGTVTSITMADIAFSIDSILAAVAMAESFPARFGDRGKLIIVIVGGVLGIITMRFVVRYFIILLERFPGLDEGAYYLVAWIGLKLMISGFHTPGYLPFHIPEPLFWVGMLLIAVVSLLVKPRASAEEAASMSASRGLLESDTDSSADDRDGPRSGAPDGSNQSDSPS
jgi:YkoY family integral membrane protein